MYKRQVNIRELPGALGDIFRGAFTLRAAGGGAAGYGIARAMRYGLARGVYTNEAGLGSSAIAHAASAERDPVKQGLLGIFEVFLDSVCLDENLLVYLIDILKRHAEPEFTKLSHAAARTELKLDDFLAWLGNKELLGSEEERTCAAIMDKCLYRLEAEGEMELAAALLCGDEQTFKLFRTQAPELVHLPDATYEWYCKNYLDSYYPVRFILHHQGIEFPQA